MGSNMVIDTVIILGVNGVLVVTFLRLSFLSDPDGRGENMPMTLTELSVYMKEQEQLRIEKEREDGINLFSFLL